MKALIILLAISYGVIDLNCMNHQPVFNLIINDQKVYKLDKNNKDDIMLPQKIRLETEEGVVYFKISLVEGGRLIW